MQRRGVAFDDAFEFQIFALRHDRHVMVADRPAENIRAARPGAVSGDGNRPLDKSDACCGGKDLVALAAIDNFGIAGNISIPRSAVGFDLIRFRCNNPCHLLPMRGVAHASQNIAMHCRVRPVALDQSLLFELRRFFT
jgi:hypothetical protein